MPVAEAPPAKAAATTPEASPSTQDPAAKPFSFDGRMEFDSAEDAAMVRNSLAVDPELRPQQVSRKLTVEGSTLVMHFEAVEVRLLRAAVGTFFDLLVLATQTLETFRLPAS